MKDLKRWVEDEGAYRFIRDYQYKNSNNHLDEKLIQKTLKTQLENCFLKNSLRELDIIREPETLDGKKPDYWIKYGFIGPIVIEIKLVYMPEVQSESKRKEYKEYLSRYLNAFNAKFGIFLIFRVNPDDKNCDTKISELKKLYEGTNIEVIYLDCIDEISNC